MPTIVADDLRSMSVRILMAAGADQPNAERVAEGLVSADLSGVDTHGVFQLPKYVSEIKKGHVVPTAKPEIVSETPTTALITGNWTFGFVVAKYGLEVAIEKAREQNVAVIGLMQTVHIGRLGEYSEIAAANGMACLIWASGYSQMQQTAVPYGGRDKVLNTNPLSIGFPVGEGSPMVLDFATTATAGGKVMLAKTKGTQVPPGSIVDKDGNPTTDPEDFVNGGAQLPFGGHKGYGVMLAVEFLGRILTGSDAYAESGRGGNHRHQGVTMMVMKADLFSPMSDVAGRADDMARQLRAVPPAPGFKEVLVPGDLEARTRAARSKEGIPLADGVWESLVEAAASVGVEL